MDVLKASLKHFVVQRLKVSNQQAVEYILSGRVQINGSNGQLQQGLLPEDEITFDNQVLKEPKPFVYLAYYKPRGIETTLNPAIPDSLINDLHVESRVFPVGRLDKESEGLLLLTDNGKVYNAIIHAESYQEKEYRVMVDQPLTPVALHHLAEGIIIMGQKTRPAKVEQLDSNTFTITLTQGLNRQIRRMCYKLGYQVQQLIRTRIINIQLNNLQTGEWRHLSQSEIQELLQILSTKVG